MPCKYDDISECQPPVCTILAIIFDKQINLHKIFTTETCILKASICIFVYYKNPTFFFFWGKWGEGEILANTVDLSMVKRWFNMWITPRQQNLWAEIILISDNTLFWFTHNMVIFCTLARQLTLWEYFCEYQLLSLRQHPQRVAICTGSYVVLYHIQDRILNHERIASPHSFHICGVQ